MKYQLKSFTVSPPASAAMCCEACVYGRGSHARFCAAAVHSLRPGGYYDYIDPHDGPVIEGLEACEVVYARSQPEYRPLRTLRSETGKVMSRWSPTPEQRAAIAKGADIYLTLHTFHQPLQPILMAVGEDLAVGQFPQFNR